jgi:hypothetical protein
MIQGISLLLGFQLAGEVVKRLAHVPVPGPIIGLLLLFAFLQARTFVDLKTSEDFDTSAAAQVANAAAASPRGPVRAVGRGRVGILRTVRPAGPCRCVRSGGVYPRHHGRGSSRFRRHAIARKKTA